MGRQVFEGDVRAVVKYRGYSVRVPMAPDIFRLVKIGLPML